MNILIMGGPGVGKGTMSAKIASCYGLEHISTGDIFRSEISHATTVGKAAQSYMDKGYLVPDNLVNDMVKSYLENTANPRKGFLLDGYPRTLEQAKAFDDLAKDSAYAINLVLYLDIDFAVLAKRISGRRLCKKCGSIYHTQSNPPRISGKCDACGSVLYQRDDDTKESLEIRLQEYSKLTQPLLSYYENQGLVQKIDANMQIARVWEAIQQVIDRHC